MAERHSSSGLRPAMALTVALAITVGACTASEEPAVTSTRAPEPTVATSPTTTESPTTASTTTPYEVPEHDIAVRVIDGRGEFYQRDTGELFKPIGPNFHVFHSGPNFVVDQLFAPMSYDRAFIAEQFREMRSLGYNVVRTSLDLCSQDCIGSASGGLRAEWLDNVADFIRVAKDNGLYVILTSNDLPLLAGYVPIVESTCCDPFDGYINSHYLSPVGVEQWSTYWTEVVKGLVGRETPLDAILAYQIRGELWLWRDHPPLSLEEGLVTTGNGNTYDMADAAQKEAMIADNVAHWIDEVGGAIRDLDPTALITVGLFVPNSPNQWRPPDDPRLVPDVGTVAASSIDFVDLHLYPGYISISQLMENFNLPEVAEKPLIIGETGGFKFVFGSPAEAAYGLQQWQTKSCDYDIQGWMFWHWLGTDDHEVWTGSEGDGAIRDVFAPTNRPDPCSQGDFAFFEDNLALGKPVRASGSIDGGAPELAIDGWNSSAWQSGGEPSQWIEIDLESEHTVRAVRLVPSQYPEGPTIHVVEMAGEDGAMSVVHRFEETTSDGKALVHEFSDPPTGVRYVRVTTTSSPSFVSWYEVAVLGE